jgi:hypothetical protein
MASYDVARTIHQTLLDGFYVSEKGVIGSADE